MKAQYKDVREIINNTLRERAKIPRYVPPDLSPDRAGDLMRGGIRKVLRIIEQAPVADVVAVVRCKECQHRYSTYDCPMRRIVAPAEGLMYYEDFTTDEGFCDRGERRTNDSAL